MQFINVSAAHSHGVQVCEILAVHKAEEDEKDHRNNRSQKKTNKYFLLHHHAFTGKEKHTLISILKITF